MDTNTSLEPESLSRKKPSRLTRAQRTAIEYALRNAERAHRLIHSSDYALCRRQSMASGSPLMSDTVHIRQNRGKHKLLACVPCEKCGSTLYPDSAELVRYRVRQVSTGFMQAPAFYYSHAPSCPEVNS